jgi:hypothetical protein
LIAELLGGEIARFKVGYSRISICKSWRSFGRNEADEEIQDL